MQNIIGQNKIKEGIQILIDGNDIIPHVLLHGPSGLGKTTFANEISRQKSTLTQHVNAANIKNISYMIPYLMNIEFGDILFIDEIHRLPTKVQESMYTVLENFRFDLVTPGSSSGTQAYKLPNFTCIGATTEPGSLLSPFLHRFKVQFMMESYSNSEIAQILELNNKNKLVFSYDYLSEFCQGIPRLAKNFLEWITIYCYSKNIKVISNYEIDQILQYRGVYKKGLTDQEIKYMRFLYQFTDPVGLNTIMTSTLFDKKTIENIIEPLLVNEKLLFKTHRGRVLIKNRYRDYMKECGLPVQ